MNPIPNIAKRKANTTCSEGIYPRSIAQQSPLFILKNWGRFAAHRG